MRSLHSFPTRRSSDLPNNPFIKTLSTIPVAPGVRVNSIVAVKGEGPYEDGDDGVVQYQSAHIDGVRSEEHTSELQSLRHIVCRLLLEKKKSQNLTFTN